MQFPWTTISCGHGNCVAPLDGIRACALWRPSWKHGAPLNDIKARGVSVTRSRSLYPPVKASWLAARVATLVVVRLVVFNLQVVLASATMAVPRKRGYRPASDYLAVNSQINQEAGMARLREARVFRKLDMLHGCL